MENQVVRMHALFCELTDQELPINYNRSCVWVEFIRRGMTADDLRLVVHKLRGEIREQRRWPSALMFRNLVENVDKFEEDLAFFRAQMRGQRSPAQKSKDSALRASGRPEQDLSAKVVTPKEVFERLHAAASGTSETSKE